MTIEFIRIMFLSIAKKFIHQRKEFVLWSIFDCGCETKKMANNKMQVAFKFIYRMTKHHHYSAISIIPIATIEIVIMWKIFGWIKLINRNVLTVMFHFTARGGIFHLKLPRFTIPVDRYKRAFGIVKYMRQIEQNMEWRGKEGNRR